MKEQKSYLNEENYMVLSDEELSNGTSKISSGTEGSFFEDEDKNLLDKKELNKKKNLVNNAISFTNKFEYIKNANFIYLFYCENINIILIMNILSIICFLIIFIINLFFKIFFKKEVISNYYIILISVMLIPFLVFTLVKLISIFKIFRSNDEENDENKDIIKLIIQKWNIYYSISFFIFAINLSVKLIVIDIFQYNSKFILFLYIFNIFISLIIFGIIYYFTKSSNNILISNIIDIISFPLSISVLFCFTIIIFVEHFSILVYNSSLYCFLLSCLSLLLMVYYNDILFSFLIFLYQLGGIKNISFHYMNFHTFCTIFNLVFIFYMSFKSIRKHFFNQNEENVYSLIKEEDIENKEDEFID